MNKEKYQREKVKLAKVREEAMKIARDFVELVDKKIAEKMVNNLQKNNRSKNHADLINNKKQRPS